MDTKQITSLQNEQEQPLLDISQYTSFDLSQMNDFQISLALEYLLERIS